jgi:hypothetical protein
MTFVYQEVQIMTFRRHKDVEKILVNALVQNAVAGKVIWSTYDGRNAKETLAFIYPHLSIEAVTCRLYIDIRPEIINIAGNCEVVLNGNNFYYVVLRRGSPGSVLAPLLYYRAKGDMKLWISREINFIHICKQSKGIHVVLLSNGRDACRDRTKAR